MATQLTPLMEVEAMRNCYQREIRMRKEWFKKQQWILDHQREIAKKVEKVYEDHKCCILDDRDPLDNTKISTRIFPGTVKSRMGFVLPKTPFPRTTNAIYGRFPRYEIDPYERCKK